MVVRPGVYRYTPRSFLRAVRAGVFGDRKVEMIEGIPYVMGTNPPHITTVIRLLALLMEVFPRDCWTVADEKMVRIGRSTPIPDLIVLRGPISDYDARPITPEDMLRIVEVCDSSWAKDRTEKLPVYARAGIPECWLVRLRKRCVYRYTGPTPEGHGPPRSTRRPKASRSATLRWPSPTSCHGAPEPRRRATALITAPVMGSEGGESRTTRPPVPSRGPEGSQAPWGVSRGTSVREHDRLASLTDPPADHEPSR